MLRIALTKGRIEEKTLELLDRAGYDTSPLRNKGRRLIIETPDNLEFIFAKAADVVTYIEHGVCDLGVVGRDTLLEAAHSPSREIGSGSIYELLDLGFGKCGFALAGPKGQNPLAGFGARTVASKYPFFTAAYFERRGLDVGVVKIDGSVELAPLLGLADAIVDIVETGGTLVANGLEVYEYIADISARLVASPAKMKLKREEMTRFCERIASEKAKS